MYAKVLVIGHVGKDPEMRYTPSGVPVTSFTVATNRRWKSATGEQQEKTTWFSVTCWRKQAEFAAQYITKGKLIFVEGDVEARAYTDREGNARASLELTATNIQFVGGRDDGGERGGGGHAAAGRDEGEVPVHEDEIPF